MKTIDVINMEDIKKVAKEIIRKETAFIYVQLDKQARRLGDIEQLIRIYNGKIKVGKNGK